MKVAHVLTRLLRAGSEENTIQSSLAQARAGHEVHIVHGREYDASYYRTLGAGIQLHRMKSLVHPIAPVEDCRALRELTSLFRTLQPDLVHTHQSKAGILGRLAAHAARVRIIVHGVHIVPFVNVGRVQRGVYLMAERAAAAVTDGFIDVSGGMRDICVAHKVGRPEQHHVIHSGFDLSRFKTAAPPDDWRTILGIGPDDTKPPTIVMVAALEARKRHREFLQVFPELLARIPTAKLVMPGSGPLLDEIQQMIRDLRLESSARLIGYRADVERIIAMADLCLLTSNREGLPRVVMQYLAAGKPCVVSNLPGLDEVLMDGVNGIVVPPADLRAAARACADLLLDRNALHCLVEGARETDLSSWDVERMCARIENVYAVLSQAAAP